MSLVGKQVDTYCTKCKLVLAHIVLYEVGGSIGKVQCKTCGSQHKYRTIKQGEKKSSSTVIRFRRANQEKEKIIPNTVQPVDRIKPLPIPQKQHIEHAVEELEQWQKKYRQLQQETTIQAYSMEKSYEKGDVIDHPKFGVGFVEKVVTKTSMDVLFKNAVKLMAMNHQA